MQTHPIDPDGIRYALRSNPAYLADRDRGPARSDPIHHGAESDSQKYADAQGWGLSSSRQNPCLEEWAIGAIYLTTVINALILVLF